MGTNHLLLGRALLAFAGATLAWVGSAEGALCTGDALCPGSTPRYFSHPNYANSPLRLADAVVNISDASGTGADAVATVDPATGAITAIDVLNGGSGYSAAPAITIVSPIAHGTGALAAATVDGNGAITAISVVDGGSGYVTPGIRKFVDTLPGLTQAGTNNLGQYIPVPVPDTTTYPGSDYYEIALVQYREKMHSDLPATLLRGYVQLQTNNLTDANGNRITSSVQLTNAMLDGSEVIIPGKFGVDKPHYLGPAIVAQKDRPVRIKFYNLLPTGQGGNLFIPVDVSVMGAGMGPNMNGMAVELDPQNPMCGQDPKPADCYSENRATLHLHGGLNPWISDGSPHQWITPAGENTPYPQGVSVSPVPDMGDNNDPADGSMTFYYTNQQSARLMFYHDHAMGITRLNVYAGEAAAYIITDPVEQQLVNSGILPTDQIPLVVQDKTFVPDDWQLLRSDETWDKSRWGGLGSLWMPHVYSPAQNPGDASGVNQFGRWAYGPWFWPPVRSLAYGPIDNPYFDSSCDPDVTWCEPQVIPGTPNVSMGMESFQDTPVVNGTVYPTVTVQPKSYRLRVLNAANDRFFNLSLYEADATGTEVALKADQVAAALEDPTVFPEVNETLSPKGPDWIQIGTEGGFLPAPAVIPAQVTTWVTDPTVFNAGNVDKHSLLLGPAERADVVVDFSRYAGKTLILYNDAPAAFPARDARYDYYTGSPDLTGSGGIPTIPAGFGPNTRTVMQIKVADVAAAAPFDLDALKAAFKSTKLGGGGAFEQAQPPIVVGQQPYNSAYGTSFTGLDGLAQIYDNWLTVKTIGGKTLSMELAPKMIQDEMGEAFEHNYGRMSGMLGVETPFAQAGLQNMILYGFDDPPTELVKVMSPAMHATPIGSTDDGTQIWKITHNGVDTHPIHFHLFDVQLINRVGWDGIVRKPDANELGWKDTVRISPLEDTIVALRPLVPTVPFDLPNSMRLLDPNMPEGAVLASATMAAANGAPIFTSDPNGEPVDIFNHTVNFGLEYVWHCHILSHEEMDMMRPLVAGVAPRTPTDLTASKNGTSVNLSWMDNSANETSFILQRATDPSFSTGLATIEVSADRQTYRDTVAGNNVYYYRVFARNLVGDAFDYSDPALNEGAAFPTLATDSVASNTATVGIIPGAVPAAPSNAAAAVANGPSIRVTWNDNANNETGYVIERSTDGGVTFTRLTVTAANVRTFTDATVLVGKLFTYRVYAVNGRGNSAYSNVASATVPTLPAAASILTGTAKLVGTRAQVDLKWTDNATNETGFTIQRATDLNFTQNLNTRTVAANTTTFNTGNLSRKTTYYFRVNAYNLAGVSKWTNIVKVTTP